ncbi:MAG TPA: hypothetical protein VGE08_16695 [Steroidobacter sp.]|uniref:hypothetical protein n=1 Tax=Steroidobacter sp. TaxID=1978227 RepID=UPI002ED9BA50
MAIKSQQIIGIAGAFVLVGAALWASSTLLDTDENVPSVEINQLQERSWAVEITDLGAAEPASEKRTASARH